MWQQWPIFKPQQLSSICSSQSRHMFSWLLESISHLHTVPSSHFTHWHYLLGLYRYFNLLSQPRTTDCIQIPNAYVLSSVGLFATLWTTAHQAPLSMGFSQQEYWSDGSFLLQEIFQTQGSDPRLLHFRLILSRWAIGKASNVSCPSRLEVHGGRDCGWLIYHSIHTQHSVWLVVSMGCF